MLNEKLNGILIIILAIVLAIFILTVPDWVYWIYCSGHNIGLWSLFILCQILNCLAKFFLFLKSHCAINKANSTMKLISYTLF